MDNDREVAFQNAMPNNSVVRDDEASSLLLVVN